jgi:hypothetical protein
VRQNVIGEVGAHASKLIRPGRLDELATSSNNLFVVKTISKTAAAVLDLLTEGLSNPFECRRNSSRRFNNAEGTFMAVSVERLGNNHYSVAQYVEQNGHLYPDPEMEFIKISDFWLAISMTHRSRRFEALKCEQLPDGTLMVTHVCADHLNDQSSFCTTWMRNIEDQQGLRAQCASCRAATKTESATISQIRPE